MTEHRPITNKLEIHQPIPRNLHIAPTNHTHHTTSGVARICEEGQSWKLGHAALTADFRGQV